MNPDDMRACDRCVSGYADLVLEAGTLPSEQEASLLQVKHCASELLTLLNDILDLGKVSGRPNARAFLESFPWRLCLTGVIGALCD